MGINEIKQFQRLVDSHTRLSAYTTQRYPLFGLHLKPLTLRFWAILLEEGSPILKKKYDEVALTRFILIMHEDCKILNTIEQDKLVRDEYANALEAWNAGQGFLGKEGKVWKAVCDYIDLHFMDERATIIELPSEYKKPARHFDFNACLIAEYVHMLASEYHWSEDTILDLPLRRLWMYVRAIKHSGAHRSGNAYEETNPNIDKATTNYLKSKKGKISDTGVRKD